MKKVDLNQIGRVMDVSTVKADVTFEEVNKMIEIVKEYDCICASPMPCFTQYTIDQLSNRDDIVVTGVVGFPAGAETTEIKVATAKSNIAMGCKELDMVMNISQFKSGLLDRVESDIKAVVDAANGVPVKVILEISYLSDDEIRTASKLAVRAGATYIKTGTGWAGQPTTVHTIKVIREAIGDTALIKAAGGVASLDILLEMIEAGCDRFGVGVRTALAILEEAKSRAEQ